MFKAVFVALVAATALVSASPTDTPRVFKSTKFSGNFSDGIVGSLNLKSRAGSSLEGRQDGSFDGLVVLCGGSDCASDCFEISTQGGGPTGQCEFTLPNPFFSFGLTNPPVGTFFPFSIGINLAPAACPTDLFDLTEANVCFNVPGGGNGWTFEAGDIAGED